MIVNLRLIPNTINISDGNSQLIPKNKFIKQQRKLQKQQISVIFNYSKITLTDSMERVLNRGLNFCILPLKLDLTQVLVEFKQFERTMVWKEFWYDSEKEKDYEPSIFKSKKTNFPRNYNVPNGLKTFLSSVKSEILDPKNRNRVQNNLPPDEMKALKQLIQYQKERQIVIKPCDKGAGLIILNFDGPP